jgi:hypothetical protein
MAEGVVALAAPAPGVGVHEPHIAIDPANPDRIAAGAQYGIRSGHGGYSMRIWTTDDGGGSWFDARVPRPLFDDGFMADPFLVYTEDRGLLYFGDCAPRLVGEAIDRPRFSRFDVPNYWDIGVEEIDRMRASAPDWRMGVSRSEDNGQTFTGFLMHDSEDSDKPSVGVDRSLQSPHYGTVYAGWVANFSPTLFVARSTDHGRTFHPPVRIEAAAPAHRFQLVVAADGVVHVVWFTHYLPEDGPPDAATPIWHGRSTDGGLTFDEPRIVGRHGGPEKTSLPTLATDAGGGLLFVWGETDTLPDAAERPVRQARRRLVGISSEDGVDWTDPAELAPWVPAGTHAGLPAVASDGESWWLVCYLADDEKTEVVLLRSGDGAQLELERTLATRAIPVDRIRLWGAHELVYCHDVAQTGDYIGIGATPERVAAVFILPETDEPTSTATAYVATEETR